jgi:NAD(P)H-dependent flavin oxidoreductase YrpB (nitropropane dioxygenase family)
MNSELESANPAAAGRISKEPHPEGSQEVTQLLANWSHGDHAALEKLIPLLLDSGVRRGSDVVKALCLGARAVMIGRAYAYGLGAAGRAGVTRAIEILRADIVRTLKLLGCASIADLDRSFIDIPPDWLAK